MKKAAKSANAQFKNTIVLMSYDLMRVKKKPVDIVMPSEIVETDIEDLIRCSSTKFVPSKTSLSWKNGYVYCFIYRMMEHPEPKVYVLEACRSKMPEFKTSVEIRVPAMITMAVVKAKGIDAEILNQLKL